MQGASLSYSSGVHLSRLNYASTVERHYLRRIVMRNDNLNQNTDEHLSVDEKAKKEQQNLDNLEAAKEKAKADKKAGKTSKNAQDPNKPYNPADEKEQVLSEPNLTPKEDLKDVYGVVDDAGQDWDHSTVVNTAKTFQEAVAWAEITNRRQASIVKFDENGAKTKVR